VERSYRVGDVAGPRRGSREWRYGVRTGADNEWALYGMVVTWPLRSVGGRECGSWTAVDVRFEVVRRTWRWAVGGSLKTVTETQYGMDEVIVAGMRHWDAEGVWGRSLRGNAGCMRQRVGRSLGVWVLVIAGMGRWDVGGNGCWDAMSNGREGPLASALLGCMQSLGRDKVYVSDSRWDATLGRRWRQSLGLRMDETDCHPLFSCRQLLGCNGEMRGS
jgi:hypothetical protein